MRIISFLTRWCQNLKSLRLKLTLEAAARDACAELPLAQADQLQQMAAGETASREGQSV
jgi:hypothetical protein